MSSNEVGKANRFLRNQRDKYNQGGIYSDQEDNDSSKSLFATSISHSFNSFAEFNLPSRKMKIDSEKEKLAKLSNSRQSIFSTPLIEFDSLHQNLRRQNTSTILKSPQNRMRIDSLNVKSDS